MEIDWSKEHIKFDKVLNSLDTFTIGFCLLLEKQRIKYVLISGYVTILFGRSRSSEDIDMFIERLTQERFYTLWETLQKTYECLNTSKKEEAYHEYLAKKCSIRFSLKGIFLPNMKVKFTDKPTHFAALNGRIKVTVSKNNVWIAPLEGQIAFKLYLGSDKDIEDARHLFRVFEEYLNKEVLRKEIQKLQIRKELLSDIGWI